MVERVKVKMKNPATKDRIKALLDGVTKSDLQDRAKVKRLVKSSSKVLSEPLSDLQEEQMVNFVIAQKIDPKSTLHLIKLWAMFR
nr:stage VI sporulation protein F [Cohnella sp. GbtcB17]